MRKPTLPRLRATLVVALSTSLAVAQDRVRFGRDVRPILAASCFKCHGPDAARRKAELRLDVRAEAEAAGVLGDGDAQSSILLERVFHADPDERMPPADSGVVLTDAQRDVLRRWIEQGAEYEAHWSFVAPVRPQLPENADASFVLNPIDAFTHARMREHGLTPSPAADRATLLRRLSLDLTGLPPTTSELDAFLSDPAPDAYARVLDRLFASPHYGERMAWPWLDAARYADSNGYQHDGDRYAWPWRDWLIRALNANQRLDQLVVAMLAGDLLPDPTTDELVATAFVRHHPINDEGGAILDEVRFNYAVDRTNTVATLFLGLTLGCAQCHDHKFDQVAQRDYYRFLAFFDNVDETGGVDVHRRNRYHTYSVAKPLLELADGERRLQLEQARSAADAAKKAYDTVAKAIDEAERQWTTSATDADIAALSPRIRATVLKLRGTPLVGAEARMLRTHFVTEVSDHEEWQRLQLAHDQAQLDLAIAHEAAPAVMIMRERDGARRETRVRARGAYDAPVGDALTPGIPDALGALPDGASANRLGLARWITAPQNPLFARVAVNLAWQTFFGRGLVPTPGDFGATGQAPSHPELLDWLAVELVESGFDMKHLHRLIVSSATYRQSARVDASQSELDPACIWLARSPRPRLGSAMLRDQALAIGGLLDREMFGAPVYPYHPEGLWADVSFEVFDYPHLRPGNQHRRTIYSFWRRTVAPPNLFDTANRLDCVVAPQRTNTPLHALVVLDETGFVEAARGLAQRVLAEPGDDPQRCALLMRSAVARAPSASELDVLAGLLARERQRYREDRAAATAFLAVGVTPVPADLDIAELAAWTVAAQLVLNLDEVLCRP